DVEEVSDRQALVHAEEGQTELDALLNDLVAVCIVELEAGLEPRIELPRSHAVLTEKLLHDRDLNVYSARILREELNVVDDALRVARKLVDLVARRDHVIVRAR